MYTIRPFVGTDAEYTRLAEIANIIDPDEPVTPAEMRHYDQTRNSAYLYTRTVCVLSAAAGSDEAGRIVGHSVVYVPYWAYVPGKYCVQIGVDPAYERQGIGTALYDHALTQLAGQTPPPAQLEATTRSDCPQGMHFLETRGFTQVMRWWHSVLDLSTFDPTPFADLRARLKAQGMKFCTAADLREWDPAWQQHIYELDREAFLDEPQPSPPTPISFDEYEKLVFNNPNFRAERFFLVVDGDQVVAMNELPINPADPSTIYTGFTGVKRSHRRRGLALALKVFGLEYLQSQEIRMVHSGNEESNPMYQINLRLGFQPTVARLAYNKKLSV
ncbi:MAG: GNAT family N-acetyltransferase [Caldilineaceae bacterium]|nr:GNAT family N-acetyltransferase [Caldilineaceae bacterium]